MKRFALISLVLLLHPLQFQSHAEETLPSARALLDQVIANLPREPLDLYGRIVTRKRRGIVVQNLHFHIALRWGATPAQATYTLMDASGLPLDRLMATWTDDDVSLAYFTGDPLQDADLPDMQAAVRETDFSWSDLALSFLWWTPQDDVQVDSFKGRDCLVIEVLAPPPPSGSTGATPRYKRVKLWIDTKANMMLKAQALDDEGKEIRSLWVWSIKQIGEAWMIKDLEIKEPNSPHRTSVLVDRVLKDGVEYPSK